MSYMREVFVVTYKANKEANCTLHDLAGNLLTGYKGGNSAKNTLSIIGRDYLISALKDDPVIIVWQFNKIVPYRKINVPGRVTALTVSHCAQYCVAAIGKYVYIWEVDSGNLVNVLDYHSQDVTKLKFSNNSTFLVTGGKDGVVCVFSYSEIMRPSSMESSRKTKPKLPKAKHVWLDHTAAISDIHITTMLDLYGRVYTASKDFTCRIYQIDTGDLMCVIRLDAPLSAVAVDLTESMLFLGAYSGEIFRIKLVHASDPQIDYDETEELFKIEKHKHEITSLNLSENILISCSEDGILCIWNTFDLSCIKKYEFPGEITDLLICPVPPGITDEEYEPDFPVQNFKREISDEDDDDEMKLYIGNNNLSLIDAGGHKVSVFGNLTDCHEELITTQLTDSDAEMERLTQINNELYAFALGDVSVVEERESSTDDVEVAHVSD